MTPSAIWHDIGAGETFWTRLLRLLFLCFAAVTFYFFAVLPLTWPQQAVLGLLSLIIALAMARSSDSYLVTLTLMILSTFCTFRYGYWRITQVIRFFHDPANHWGALDAFFILCLLLAEVYAFLILFLGYFQTIWPLRRAPVDLPDNPEEWPHVDVIIPTYNEPLDVVRYTALGAMNMDWPSDKLHIYILDDGHREDFKQFAEDAGIGYRTRPENVFAKAGNINAALETIHSPFVAVFDSDHVPTRSFLQMTVGWFLRDRNLGILQTPHHFYSPDPFERNLQQFRVIPNEGELFYGIVQDGNDFWNASYFCGSCAVLRRSALDEIGGVAVETVTEDAHTSLRMQMAGWGTAYINIPQAAGLATERLSAHVGQRIRWARGMIQILRTDNPLFARGLKLPQRLCYFNAMCHFLYPVPRLIFLTAPLIYLLLNHTNIPGYWAAILSYALPHLTLSNVANSRIQGEHRHSFWNEIYETVLAPYILLPTMLALISPRLGKFNVTAKGGVVKRTFFDRKIAQPFLVMLVFNIAGLIVAIPRLFLWDTNRQGTVLMNVLWCSFNLVILGVCTAVARELRQLRNTVRISVVTPVMALMPDGTLITGETMDMSSGGTSIRLTFPPNLPPDRAVRLHFPMPTPGIEIPAVVVESNDLVLRVKFKDLTLAEEESLTMVLYSRADSWLGWGESRETDHVLHSLARIFHISMHGLAATFRSLFTSSERSDGDSGSLSIARSFLTYLLIALCLGGSAKTAAQSQAAIPATPTVQAPTPSPPRPPAASPVQPANAPATPAPGTYVDRFTLADTGSPQIELHGINSAHNIYFTLPQTHVPSAARLHLFYSFSPSLLPQLSHLNLIVNGTLIANVQPTANPAGGSDSRDSEVEFPIPPELLVHNNTLTIEFIGHYTTNCEDPTSSAIWARVHRNTYFEISGNQLPIADDLKQLPTPFLDPAVVQPLSLPVVFLTTPTFKAMQAAGIVASYFGMLSDARPVRFPVHIGAIPAGNAVLIADDATSLPADLNLSQPHLPTVAIRTNPNDPFSKLLIITGADSDQTVAAAQAIALHSEALVGPQAAIETLRLPSPQQPDAAPRWARVEKKIALSSYASETQLQGDGSAPLNVYFRIPPDLYYTDQRPNAVLHLVYRYNSVPIGPISSLQIRMNNAFIQSIPLPPGRETSRQMQVDVPIPIVNLRPFSNSLTFDFTFQIVRKGGCEDTTPINLLGAIQPGSYIDITGYPHYTALPNLELFANAGFPFTRLADLSQTTVVLPPAPTEQEMETFLTLMGHFGRQSGFPALRVNVTGPQALRNGAHSDFLIIGSDDDQPAFDRLDANLPVSLRSGKIQVHDTQGIFAPLLHHAWWKPEPTEHLDSGDLIAGATPQAVIEGIESPFDPHENRSIVAIHLNDSAAFPAFMSTFLEVQQASDISGNVAVLKGLDQNAQFQSFRIGSAVYYVGVLPWWTRLTLWFMQVPWLAAVIVVAFAFLLAFWMRQWLRARARARLRMTEE